LNISQAKFAQVAYNRYDKSAYIVAWFEAFFIGFQGVIWLNRCIFSGGMPVYGGNKIPLFLVPHRELHSAATEI
jgi:hypothetical protein